LLLESLIDHVTLQFDRLQPDGTVSGKPLRNTLPGLQLAGNVVTQQFRPESNVVVGCVQLLEKVMQASGHCSMIGLEPTPDPVIVQLMPWKT
jgi:hypothetical protein